MEGKNIVGEKKEPYRKLIILLSVVIPVAVAVLLSTPKIPGYDLSFLPPIYATLNGLTAILLTVAVIAIKNGNRSLHERLIKI
jgi:putative membrane protein